MNNPNDINEAGVALPQNCSALMIALRDYIDARIDEELAILEEGADGYRRTALQERKAREAAWERVVLMSLPPQDHE